MVNNKEELQQAIKEIGKCAVKLYDLMDPGTTIDVKLPDSGTIMTPHQTPKARRLIITKPNVHLALTLTPINNTN